MILHEVRLHDQAGFWNIHVENGKIKDILNSDISTSTVNGGIQFQFEGALALPGFINSHDHLDFNLFPRLGKQVYVNYQDWGPLIQGENQALIKTIHDIPLDTRVKWGIYKNLLNGFTTVVNHGEQLNVGNELVHVLQSEQSLHSVGFEKNWKRKLNAPFRFNKKLIIHLGEGTDERAKAEIDEIIKANYLKRKIIAVHGVALQPEQATKLFGLVWCPASNFFLLNKTAPIHKLAGIINTVFGTDSTLTSPWNIWEHFRQALNTEMVTEIMLIKMLTTMPAKLWNLKETGSLEREKKADLVIIRKAGNLFKQNPEDILMVIKNGELQMLDLGVKQTGVDTAAFNRIRINDTVKLVKGNIKEVVEDVRKHYEKADIPFEL